MLKLKSVMDANNVTNRALAAELEISDAAISLFLNHGAIPKRYTEREFRAWVGLALLRLGIPGDELGVEVFEQVEEVVAGCANTPQPCSVVNETSEVDMLIRKQTLKQETKEHFKLSRNPFSDDLTAAEDVFLSPRHREILNDMESAFLHGRFMAVVGESGCGKTTLRELCEERVARSGQEVVIIRPHSVIGMEENDTAGKTMKVSQISEAIIRSLSPATRMFRSQEARLDQMRNMLVESYRAGKRHCLVIDEAHALPKSTLKHLKRLREDNKHGMAMLLGVLLIGQPELLQRLREDDPGVREVVQRCELVTFPPIDKYLGEYLAHRFSRAGIIRFDQVFEDDAAGAIADKLTKIKNIEKRERGQTIIDTSTTSLIYPLAVNNVATAALNMAASLGAPKVTAAIVGRA